MKSFNKISSIIFCWIALNINICYCTNNGNIINEDLGHTTTNKLLQISNKLFTSNYDIYKQNKNNIKHEMEQFICQINDFFNNNFDNDNLEKLIDIVYLNADYDRIINNIKKLYNNNIFNQDKYKELLKFILSIHIMCYIEHYYDGWSLCYKDVECLCYDVLKPNTSAIIQELTKLFISKYFDLKNPDKWIPKKELISNIKNEIKKIKDILNNFNLLQIDNDEIFIEDYIPCNVQYNIYKEIMNFFNTEEWQKILETKIQTFKEYSNIRNDEQIKNHNGKLSKIKSIYNMREINNYIDEELKNAGKIAEIANDYTEKHLNDIDEDYDEL